MTDGRDKPGKPDPFAPLPLADLPPVRGKDTSGPIPRPSKDTSGPIPKPSKQGASGATRGDTMPGATPATIPPPATTTPDAPNALAQPAPAPADVSWTSTSGQRLGGVPNTAAPDETRAAAAGPPLAAATLDDSWTSAPGAPMASDELGPAGGSTSAGVAFTVAGGTSTSGEPRTSGALPHAGEPTPSGELGPAGAAPSAANAFTASGGVATGGPVWETPAGSSWSGTSVEAWTEAPPAPPALSPAPAAEPLLPAAYNDDELRSALGVTPRAEPDKKGKKAKKPPPRDDDDGDDDGGGRRRSRKGMFIGALAIVMGGGITAMVLLGKANAERYYITCEADQVVVEQGRSFPPWGSSALDGAEWKPLKIPPETVCAPRETENQAELAGWYLKMLTDFADKQLSARDATRVDESEAVLKQALLVSRLLPAEAAKDARNEIDRLLGDVVYWRASTRMKGAADALSDAAKQFDAAAAARPAHFKDAAEWAKHTRELVERLRAGPGGTPSVALPPGPSPERPSAPPGVALPVEPDGSGAGSAEPTPPPAPVTAPSSGVMI